MRVAIIAPTEIPSRRANTIQVMKMAQAFVKIGQEVILVSPYTGEETPEQTLARSQSSTHIWEKLAQHYGIQVQFPVEWLPSRDQFRRYDYSLRAVQLARQRKVDLIYTRLPQAAALTGTLGMPTILEVHDIPRGVMGVKLFYRFLNSKGAQRLVVITSMLARDLAEIFNAPLPEQGKHTFTLVAPDGADLERYADISDPRTARQLLKSSWDIPPLAGAALDRLEPERFTAGYTGHLYAGRGTTLLINLAERVPDINFLFVGGDPDQVTEMLAIVEQRGLDNVVLTGFVPNQDLPRYQAACDVLLMPYQKQVAASSGGDISRYLSPMKLFEYMACGRAILSSNLPVLKEVLNPQNAMLLPPDDVEAWNDALQMLITNPEQKYKLAEQARKDVQIFSWDARAARILNGLEL